MAARAGWKSQLRLSLVSIPVELYSATRHAAKISLRACLRRWIPTGVAV